VEMNAFASRVYDADGNLVFCYPLIATSTDD